MNSSYDPPDLDLSHLLERHRKMLEKREEYNQQQIKTGKTPISPDHHLIFNWWHRVAVGQEHFPEQFRKFISLWEAFNGLLNCRLRLQNGSMGDKAKVLALSNDALLLDGWQNLVRSDDVSKSLDELRSLCPIYQVWGGERANDYRIDKPYELRDLLILIYAIRCNLFHGEKQARERDLKIVDAASRLLERVFIMARSQLLFVPLGAQTGGE
jgi:hypothetical protein